MESVHLLVAVLQFAGLPYVLIAVGIALAAIAPLLLALWGGLMWEREAGLPVGEASWISYAHTGYALLCVVMASAAIAVGRRRIILALLCGLTGLAVTAYAWFLGGMAITGSWL